jgi:hypothetical protein
MLIKEILEYILIKCGCFESCKKIYRIIIFFDHLAIKTMCNLYFYNKILKKQQYNFLLIFTSLSLKINIY